MRHVHLLRFTLVVATLLLSVSMFWASLSNWQTLNSQFLSIIDPVLIAPFVAVGVAIAMVVSLLQIRGSNGARVPSRSMIVFGGLMLAAFQYAYMGQVPLQLALLVLGLLFVGMAHGDRVALIMQISIGVVSAATLRDRVDVALVIGTTVVLALISRFGRAAITEWSNHQRVFQQAQWVAQQYSSVNLRLQEDVMRTEIWSRNRERVRVAREVHDTVGHTLTAILMQVTAVRKILAEPADVIRARLENLERMIRNAIQDVRVEVDALRRVHSLGDDWRGSYLSLCKTYADSTGIQIHSVVEEEVERIDDTTGEQVYRILQESVTNAFRHGGATYVDVAMGRHAHEFYIRISDNGCGADHPKPGNGLRGMCERVDQLGGSLVWQTYPGKGFDIGIAVPWKERAS